jgi:hypothetical protein
VPSRSSAISQSHLQRQFNELILVRVAAFGRGAGGFAREKGALTGGKGAARRVRRKEIPATTQGAQGFILYVASAGVRLQNNEPIGQFLREVAKTK